MATDIKEIKPAVAATPVKAPTLDDLVNQFTSISDAQAKSDFFHANPALAAIFNPIHFPKSTNTQTA